MKRNVFLNHCPTKAANISPKTVINKAAKAILKSKTAKQIIVAERKYIAPCIFLSSFALIICLIMGTSMLSSSLMNSATNKNKRMKTSVKRDICFETLFSNIE